MYNEINIITNFTISTEDLDNRNFPENISDKFRQEIIDNWKNIKKWGAYKSWIIEFNLYDTWLNWQEWELED